MGDRGPAHKVGTPFGSEDDLHSGGILQVIHMGDFPITWSSSLYSIRPRSQVYSSIFGELPMRHGDTVDDEHCFSSLNGRLVKEDHPDVRGHVASMRPGS